MFSDPFRSQNARQRMKKAYLGRRNNNWCNVKVKTFSSLLDARNFHRSISQWMMQPTKTGTFLHR
jgi:hypothetical protein